MFRCKPSQLWSLGLFLALLLVLCAHGASGFLTGRGSSGAGSGGGGGAGALVASSFLRSLWKRASMRASMRNSMRDSPIYYVSTFVRNKTPAQQQAAVLSPLFKIPIEFMSNARPLDVVKGIRKPPYSKPYRKQSLYQASKMILMPIKFLANGKPRRRVVIKTPPHYFRI